MAVWIQTRQTHSQLFEPKSSELRIDFSNRRIAEISIGFEKLKELGQPFAHGLRVRLFAHAHIVPRHKRTDKPTQSCFKLRFRPARRRSLPAFRSVWHRPALPRA